MCGKNIRAMKKMFFLGILALICCSALFYVLFCFVFPQYYFDNLWILPLYFFVFFVGEFLLLKVFKKKDGAKKMNIFLLTKIVKILFSITILVLYIKLINENNISFSVVFLTLYCVSLVLETVCFSKILKKNE